MVDGGVSPLELNTVFCREKEKQRNICNVALVKKDSGDVNVLMLVTRVPRVVAGRPGQVPGKREVEVENAPGQNNDVVEVQQGHNHLGAITKTCTIKNKTLPSNW